MGVARVCSFASCDKPSRAKGLCTAHYDKLRYWGDPQAGILLLEAHSYFKRLAAALARRLSYTD
jgi:hypothetical protein